MRTINFLAAFVASVMITVNANAEDKKADVSSVKVVDSTSKNCRSVVTTSDDGMSYKTDYILNEKGLVVNKITSVWNVEADEWSPMYAYSVVYTPSETVLSYAKYNSLTKTYSLNVKQVRYNASEYPEVIKLPSVCK